MLLSLVVIVNLAVVVDSVVVGVAVVSQLQLEDKSGSKQSQSF